MILGSYSRCREHGAMVAGGFGGRMWIRMQLMLMETDTYLRLNEAVLEDYGWFAKSVHSLDEWLA